MSLLVVGSVAFDAVETPFGKRERMLGGSASHFSISASFFTDVRIVAVVGGDFGAPEQAEGAPVDARLSRRSAPGAVLAAGAMTIAGRLRGLGQLEAHAPAQAAAGHGWIGHAAANPTCHSARRQVPAACSSVSTLIT